MDRILERIIGLETDSCPGEAMTVPIDLPRFNLMGGGKREKEQG